MKTLKITLFCLLLSVVQLASAQVKKKVAVSSPIVYEGNHSVANTSKAEIFKSLLASEQKLVDKKQSTILVADSLKGILSVKRLADCSFQADTTFNGKVLKNAVTKNVSYFYEVHFNIGDNIFTHKVSGFATLQGQPIMKRDAKHPQLSSCAESEIWKINDIIIGQSVLMKMKPLR